MKKKWINILLFGFLALCLVLLDTSFFSFLVLFEAQIIISFVALITFAIKADDYLTYFSGFVIIFFSIFSSLPVWLIVINFCVLPEIVFYIRKNLLPEPSVFIIPAYFIAVSFSFEFLLFLYSKEFNASGVLAIGYFVLLNTIAGVVVYGVTDKVSKMFKRGEIKI
jgi:hypothetical protein